MAPHVSSPSGPARPVSVILVREWEQQMSSSGCCGRLEGDLLASDGQPLFAVRRHMMESAGELYRAVLERFPSGVHVQIVDPRNIPALLPMLIRDFWSRRVPLKAALRTLGNLSVNSVIVNGRVFSTGCWPDASALCDHLSLARAESASDRATD